MEESFRKASPVFPLILFGGIGTLLKLFGRTVVADVVGNVFLVVTVILVVVYLVIRYRPRTH